MLLQITLTFVLALTVVVATPPPGYQKKEDTLAKKNGPKYNYGYKIAGEKGSQEKQEQRDGIYALGRYYVQGVDSSQTVEYLADDWGFHPFIEYSNVGPHSKSSTQIAFGEEAVKALRFSQKNVDSAQTLISQNVERPRLLNGQSVQGPSIFEGQPNIVYHNLPEKLIQQQQQQYIFYQNVPQVHPQHQQNLIYATQATDNKLPQQVPINIAYQSTPLKNQETVSYSYQNIHISQQPQQQQSQEEQNEYQTIAKQSQQQQFQGKQNQYQIIAKQSQQQQSQEKQTEYQNIAKQSQQQQSLGNQNEYQNIVKQEDKVIQQQNQKLLEPQGYPQVEQKTYPNVAQEQKFLVPQSNQEQENVIYQNIQESTAQEQNLAGENSGKLEYQHVRQNSQKTSNQQSNQIYTQQTSNQLNNQNVLFSQREEASYQTIPATQQTLLYQTQISEANQNIIQQNGQKILEIQKFLSQQPSNLYSNILPPTQQTLQHPGIFYITDTQSQQNLASNYAYPETYNHNQAQALKGNEQEFHSQFLIEGTPQPTVQTSNNVYIQNNPQEAQQSTDVSNQSENSNLKYYKSKLKTIDDYSQDSVESHIDKEEVYPKPGLYGTKINPKSQEKGQFRNAKLIANTKKLVTGQDVLNINDVFNQREEESSSVSVKQDDAQESVTDTSNDNSVYSTTQSPVTVTAESTLEIKESNFTKEPIVVADLEENKLNLDEDKEEFYSTTQNTVETANTVNGFETTDPTIVVTPRPVGSNFLAPITAGIQLQSVEEKVENKAKPTVVVQIQKSVPYYLGRFEYLQDQNRYIKNDESKDEKVGTQKEAQSNAELGKSLLQFRLETLPTPEALVQNLPENYQLDGQEQESKEIQSQNLPQNNYQSSNQKQESEQVNQYEKTNTAVNAEHNYQPGDQVDKQETIQVHYQIQAPYQQVLVPEQHQQIVFQQGADNYKIVPQPQIFDYQLQKEQSAGVEQKESTKYVDRPYPIEIPIPQSYPIEVSVAKNVEQKIHVQELVPQTYIVPVEVAKQYPIQITKLLPQQHPVTATKAAVPNPIEAKIPYPIPAEVPKYVDRPYSVYVKQDIYKNPYGYAPNYQINCDNLKHKTVQNLGYLPPSGASFYHTIHQNDYIGLKPPKARQLQYKSVQPSNINGNSKSNNNNNSLRKNRNARQSFGQNLRIEYGFMPPLIPSLEIDENGKPIEKNEQ